MIISQEEIAIILGKSISWHVVPDSPAGKTYTLKMDLTKAAAVLQAEIESKLPPPNPVNAE